MRGDGVWDSGSYMSVNHGVPDTSGIPDLDGDGQIIRYEVYREELANTLPTGEPEVAPVCHQAAWQPPLDRRVINAAVLIRLSSIGENYPKETVCMAEERAQRRLAAILAADVVG